MFFIVFYLIRYWLNYVIKPLIFYPSFYCLIISWLIFISSGTLIYFRMIDTERFDRLKMGLLKSIFKSALIGVLVPTFVTGFYIFGVMFTHQSGFFHQQRFNIDKLIYLFMDSNGLFALGWFRFFAASFLIVSSLKTIQYLKENSFHLQESGRENRYSGIVVCVGVLSYLFVKIFGKI